VVKIKNQNGQSAAWWQPALQLFFELWGWLVVPVIVALFLGTWLDETFQTAPLFFLVITAIAFFVTIFGIVRRSLDILNQTESQEQKKSDQQKDF